MPKNRSNSINITCKKLPSAMISKDSSTFFSMMLNDAFPGEDEKETREVYLKIFNKIKDFQVLDEPEKKLIEELLTENWFKKSYTISLENCKISKKLVCTYLYENIVKELHRMMYKASVMSILDEKDFHEGEKGSKYVSYEGEDGKKKKVEILEKVGEFIFARIIRTGSLVILKDEGGRVIPLVDYKKGYCDYEVSDVSEDVGSVIYTTNRGVNLLLGKTHIVMSEEVNYFTQEGMDFYVDRREGFIYKIDQKTGNIHTSVMPNNVAFCDYYKQYMFCIYSGEKGGKTSYRLYNIVNGEYLDIQILRIKFQTEQGLYILAENKKSIVYLDNNGGHTIIEKNIPEIISQDDFGEFMERYLDELQNPYSDIEEDFDN